MELSEITRLIKEKQNIWLTTHRQCDGDGLGSELAMHHGLKAMGKDSRIINVDPSAKKYSYLQPELHIECYLDSILSSTPILNFGGARADLCLVFDTNDERMLSPLYSELEKRVDQIIFIDHHQPLKTSTSTNLFLDTNAASTGEVTFRIMKDLGCPITKAIATCLYTSLAFDTQLFRFVRNSPQTHRIAAELLEVGIPADDIHRSLFGQQSAKKMAFIASAIGQTEYFFNGRLAVVRIRDQDLLRYDMEPDDVRDVIDMVMNIEHLEAAALFREEGPGIFKISLRSKGRFRVSEIGEVLGGGGHPFAAGALLEEKYETIRDRLLTEFGLLFHNLSV